MKSRQQRSADPKKNIAASIQKIVAKVFGFLREILNSKPKSFFPKSGGSNTYMF